MSVWIGRSCKSNLGDRARAAVVTLAAFVAFSTLAPVQAATYGQEVVAAVLLAEARGEGDDGMMAVVEVIRRRADSQGVTMLSVVKPGTFSSLNGTDRDALLKRFQRHSLFPRALEIARLAYNQPQRLRNLSRGATHFTHKAETPYWAVGHRPVIVLGNHAFYRLKS